MLVNLISVRAIQDNGYAVLFTGIDRKIIHESGGSIVLQVAKTGRLYKVKSNLIGKAYFSSMKTGASTQLWHARLGYPAYSTVKTLRDEGLLNIFDEDNNKNMMKCEACLKGRMTTTSFKRPVERGARQQLELVNSDLCGPMNVPS